MKVCYIADARSVHTRRSVGYFADRGHEVHLISLGPAPLAKGILDAVRNQIGEDD